VLDRAADSGRDVKLGGDGRAGLPDLELVRVPARVHDRARRADRRPERIGQVLDDAEPVGRAGAPAAGDDDLRLGEVGAGALLGGEALGDLGRLGRLGRVGGGEGDRFNGRPSSASSAHPSNERSTGSTESVLL
jgi:hypothetical protein